LIEFNYDAVFYKSSLYLILMMFIYTRASCVNNIDNRITSI